MSSSRLLVSFSGGRTSAFMAMWIKLNWSDRDLCFVFANTGKEMPQTLDFVNECDKRWDLGVHWIEYDPQEEWGKKNWYKILDYDTASRNGEPFEKFIAKERIPNAAYPNCSGRLKQYPIHNFVKDAVGWDDYETAIGIRADEVQRINWQSAKENGYVYPLATDYRVSKDYINKWWSNQPFDLELKDYEGNCDFCWKKSKRKLMTMALEHPEKTRWWSEMEEKYGEGEFNFFRNNESMKDIVEEANNKPFSKAIDQRELNDMQGCLFDYDMDTEGHCLCKE